MARINAKTKSTTKPNKKLRTIKKEVHIDDVYTALADMVIDSFLESRKKDDIFKRSST